MKTATDIKLFEGKKLRRIWDKEKEEYYFSIIDAIDILTESVDPSAYWRKLKERLKAEGNETVTNCHGLKMPAPDGKMRLTDVADTEQLLRLIQSIPSKKAEPFKAWLAKVGKERLDEEADPEKAINRALKSYLNKGYSREWINMRLKAIEIRKELTDEWQDRGVQRPIDFATLTNILTKAWSERTVPEYKELKGLEKESLRDNMTNMELVLNMLAEETTKEISKTEEPDTMEKNKDVAQAGGAIAGDTRKAIEKRTGKPVVTAKNAKELRRLKDGR